jgi:hypothetical protein
MQEGAVPPSLEALPQEVAALGFFLEHESALFSRRLNDALRELGESLPLNRRLRRAVNIVLGAWCVCVCVCGATCAVLGGSFTAVAPSAPSTPPCPPPPAQTT